MKREDKTLIIIALLLISYFIILYKITPFRVRPDEWNFVLDIHNGLQRGKLTANYMNGRLYPAAGVSILTVLGLSPGSLDWLSPFIASCSISIIAAISLIIFRHLNSEWWSLIVFSPVLLVFPNFLSRMRESSHKAFTTVLIILALWLLIRSVTERSDYRHQLLLLIIISIIPLYNYAWGTLVSLGLLFTLAFIKFIYQTSDSSDLESLPYQILIFPLIASYISVFHVPGVRVTLQAYLELIFGAVGFLLGIPTGSGPEQLGQGAGSGQVQGTSLTGGTSAGSVIASWPTLELGPITISVWFLYSLGVFVSATFTVIALSIIMYHRYISKIQNPVIISILIGFIYWYGILAVIVVIGGNSGALKRIISVPGILGVLIWVAILTSPDLNITIEFINNNKTKIAAVTLILLLISAPLALGRSITDGQGNPYDTYLTENEIAEMTWVKNYSSKDNQPLTTYQFKDHFAAIQTIYRPICPRKPHNFDSIIYNSGVKGLVIFDKNADPSNFATRVQCKDYYLRE